MTTEETQEVENPRELNTLLNLNTYQGMTDEEIELVINHKVMLGIMEGITQGNKVTYGMILENKLEQNKQNCEHARSMLESILDKRPQLNVVEV